MDFIVPRRKGGPVAVECKWSADSFDGKGLRAFRSAYPKGENYVVAGDVSRRFVRDLDGTAVRFLGLADFIKAMHVSW